jgi:hypothetical protein
MRLIRILVAVLLTVAAAGCGSGAPHDALVSGLFEVCSADNGPCAPGNGSIYAVDVNHRVVASERVSHGRFSLSLVPGRYMLHANERYGWCHRYHSCNAYRAVLAIAHQHQRVGLDVPPPPLRCSGRVPVIAAHGARPILESGSRVYRDAAGWMIDVPPGWQLVPFSSSKGGVVSAGAQISNVPLPAPSVLPGYPIQAPLRAQLAGGVGLVIATDSEPGLPGESRGGYITVRRLPAQDQCGWATGSALAGQPYVETLWFRGNGKTFIASVKVGPKATGTNLAAVDSIVQSLRFRPTGH